MGKNSNGPAFRFRFLGFVFLAALGLFGYKLSGKPAILDKKLSVSLGASKYCPLVCQDDRRVYGLLVDVTKMINKKLKDFAIEIEMMPFGRALEQSQKGSLAGVLGLFKTKDRETFMVFMDQPLLTGRSCFYAPQNLNWSYHGVQSLVDQKLITIAGYKYESSLQAYIDQQKGKDSIHEIFGDNEPERALKFLALERADVFIDNELIADHSIVKLGLENKIKKAGCLDEVSQLYIGVSKAEKNAAGLVEELNRAFKAVRLSSSYTKISAP